MYALFNLAIVGFVLFVSRYLNDSRNIITRIVRRWYFLLLVAFIYEETGGLVFLYFPEWMDNGLAALEFNIFGVHPTIYLQKLNFPILNEIFMFGYFMYFFLLLIYPLFLIFHKMYKELDHLTTALALTFSVCFFMFYFLPIAGPRFLFNGVYSGELNGMLFVNLSNYVIHNYAAEGGAMPSSHTAASVVMLVYSWRHSKILGIIFTPIIISLIIGTFWGRFHFVSDSVVGAVIAIICIFLADRINSHYNRKHPFLDTIKTVTKTDETVEPLEIK